MENQIGKLEARIKELELQLKAEKSKSLKAEKHSAFHNNLAQFITNNSGHIYQYNSSFISILDSSTEAGTETDLVLDFQKQNQDILDNLKSSIPKTLEFAFKNSSKEIIKTNYSVQKLNQLHKENVVYQ